MAGIPSLKELRERFNDGIISQEQYNLEQKAIMRDMSSGSRKGLHRRKLKCRGQWMEDRSRALSTALTPSEPAPKVSSFHEEPPWHDQSSFNITFDTTLDERDVQDVAKLERTVDDAYYRGVTWNSRKQRWTARLLTDGKSLSIGYFQHEKDAITASDHYQDAKWGGS